MSLEFTDIAIALLIGIGISIAFYFLVQPYLKGEIKAESRLERHGGSSGFLRDKNVQEKLKERRLKLEQTLKESEALAENTKNPPLSARIAQAGLKWDIKSFILFSLASAGAGAFIVLVLTGKFLVALGAGVVFGLLFPRSYLNFKRKKRIKTFIEELPNAVDIIVRAVKAGLPINDAIRIVASEAKEPVKSEFLYLVELQQMGFSLADAVVKLPERIPIAETNFFAISIVIQQRAGGSISEILNNLAKVLRERKKLKQRVIALSQEAKAGAAIIGSIPFLLALFLAFFAPAHMVPLFNTTAGNFMLLGCAGIMSFGIFIMHKMINIEV